MPDAPEVVVQRQFDAYNAHDIDAFLDTFSQTVEMRSLPSNELLRRGHDEVRDFYEERFSNSNLRAELLGRTVLGTMVIDHERLVGFDDGRVLVLISVVEVRDGLIQNCWFING